MKLLGKNKSIIITSYEEGFVELILKLDWSISIVSVSGGLGLSAELAGSVFSVYLNFHL